MGCLGMKGQGWSDPGAWHYTNTSYEGFNTAYGDAHVEWVSTPDDFFDDLSTCQYYVWGWSQAWCYWWK